MAAPDVHSDPTTVSDSTGLAQREKQIARTQRKLAELKQQEASIMEALERLNFELNVSRSRQKSLEGQLKKLKQQSARTTQARRTLRSQTIQLKRRAARRLIAFYKLTRLGIAPIVLSSETFWEFRLKTLALQRILGADARLWDRLEEKNNELKALAERLVAQRQHKQKLLEALRKQEAETSKRKAARAALLERIQNEKTVTQAALISMKQTANKLNGAIETWTRAAPHPENQKKPGAFLAQKGLLPMPAAGELTGTFGRSRNIGPYNLPVFRSGININATAGSLVKAVWSGRVVYANWFKGYGNVVIIDHGAHYYSLSAQLAQVFTKTGRYVHQGDVIGTVGDTATYAGRGLYFEIRHHGTPEDPRLWLGKK
ncbi:MAG: peptidoglycan DD-metalloendopeptidase family protein, partial [Deltaproteobacteria bacterium]|nr:peptidoglycan DD-metalloendopeptidase family protein [Deltaproteobacteria bacterium]